MNAKQGELKPMRFCSEPSVGFVYRMGEPVYLCEQHLAKYDEREHCKAKDFHPKPCCWNTRAEPEPAPWSDVMPLLDFIGEVRDGTSDPSIRKKASDLLIVWGEDGEPKHAPGPDYKGFADAVLEREQSASMYRNLDNEGRTVEPEPDYELMGLAIAHGVVEIECNEHAESNHDWYCYRRVDAEGGTE